LDVSFGWVFVSVKDPFYSNMTMPGKTTVIMFSEAKTEDFEQFVDETSYFQGATPHAGKARPAREAAKKIGGTKNDAWTDCCAASLILNRTWK